MNDKTKTMDDNTKSYPFEQSLKELEQLVEKMEQGDLSLEDSLKTFEKGVRLTRECQQALAKAEQRVKMLVEESGGLKEVDFDAGAAEG